MSAETSPSPHTLAGASGLLFGSVGVCMALGALAGWLLGSAALGLLVGAVLGIPVAIGVVYLVYSRSGA